MLSEVSSKEITEWMAYFKIKKERDEENSKAEEAKQKAKRQGR